MSWIFNRNTPQPISDQNNCTEKIPTIQKDFALRPTLLTGRAGQTRYYVSGEELKQDILEHGEQLFTSDFPHVKIPSRQRPFYIVKTKFVNHDTGPEVFHPGINVVHVVLDSRFNAGHSKTIVITGSSHRMENMPEIELDLYNPDLATLDFRMFCVRMRGQIATMHIKLNQTAIEWLKNDTHHHITETCLILFSTDIFVMRDALEILLMSIGAESTRNMSIERLICLLKDSINKNGSVKLENVEAWLASV